MRTTPLETSPLSASHVYGEIHARLANDRFGSEHLGDRFARGWNACADNIARAVREFEQRERMTRALGELAEAECIDLRLKNALIGA